MPVGSPAVVEGGDWGFGLCWRDGAQGTLASAPIQVGTQAARLEQSARHSDRAAVAEKPEFAASTSKGKVKVFILAGQSNMEGRGFPEPLAWQVTCSTIKLLPPLTQ